MFKCVLDEAEQILEDVRYAFGEAKMREDLSLKLNEHIKSCENTLTHFRTMMDTPEVMEAMIKDKPDKRGDTLLERMARRFVYGKHIEDYFARLSLLIEEDDLEGAKTLIPAIKSAINNTRTIYNVKERHRWERRLNDVEEGLQPDNKKRERILMAIKRAELAAKAAEEGHSGACLSYIEDAYEVLSRLEDCEEKDNVISFLKHLEENLIE